MNKYVIHQCRLPPLDNQHISMIQTVQFTYNCFTLYRNCNNKKTQIGCSPCCGVYVNKVINIFERIEREKNKVHTK
jgi:hypothetical protein